MKQKIVIVECNPIFQKEGQKGWPTGFDDSQLVLRFGCYSPDITSLLRRSDFSSKLKKKVKGWSLSDLVCSALWFAFEKKHMSTYSWSIFFTFLMHCDCTYSVLFFLEFSFIDKIFLRKDIIKGVLFALENTTFFHVDINCIKNILIFLEIEGSVIDQVIVDIKIQQNWKVIIEFLKKNQNQILRERNLSPFDEVVRLKKNDLSFANYFLLSKNEAHQKALFWERVRGHPIWGYSKLIFLTFFACKIFPRLSKNPSLVTNFDPLCAEIIELVEFGNFYQGAGIGHMVFPRPVFAQLRVSTRTPAVSNEDSVVDKESTIVEKESTTVKEETRVVKRESQKESQEVAEKQEKLFAEPSVSIGERSFSGAELPEEKRYQVIESKKSSDTESLLSDTGSVSPRQAFQKQEKLEFEFEKGNDQSVISGDSSFSSEKQSIGPEDESEIDPMSEADWERFKNMFSQRKEITSEKTKDPFRTKNKLKRTISGFVPTHQLDRTVSEGIHGFFPTNELNRTNPKDIHGFFPTNELNRTNSNLSQGEATTSQLTEVDQIGQFENTTDSSLSSNDESATTEKKLEKKGKKLAKKIKKLTKREKLDVQIEHGFNDKSFTEKGSQRIVYLEKPTSKNPNNVFKSNPGVKLKINEGESSRLNMDTSVIRYNKSDNAAEHFKHRVKHLPRTENEKNKVYELDLGQNDHSMGKNAHQNLNTNYKAANTMTVLVPIHNELTNARVKAERDGNFEMSRSLTDQMSPQDFSDIRQSRDKQTLQKISDIEFEKRGAPREAYEKSSEEIHQSDRTRLGKTQARLELTSTEHTAYAHVRNVTFSDNDQCYKAALAIEEVPVRYLHKNEIATEIIPLLERLKDSDRFAVGIRDNQPANSSLAKAIDGALLHSSDGKRVLFKTLRDKGIPVENLHKFVVLRSSNPVLKTSNIVPYNESDFFLYQSSLRSSGLSVSDLDDFGNKLGVNTVDSGRKAAISSQLNFRKPNSQRNKSQ
jgi:hypothetical protein